MFQINTNKISWIQTKKVRKISPPTRKKLSLRVGVEMTKRATPCHFDLSTGGRPEVRGQKVRRAEVRKCGG